MNSCSPFLYVSAARLLESTAESVEQSFHNPEEKEEQRPDWNPDGPGWQVPCWHR